MEEVPCCSLGLSTQRGSSQKPLSEQDIAHGRLATNHRFQPTDTSPISYRQSLQLLIRFRSNQISHDPYTNSFFFFKASGEEHTAHQVPPALNRLTKQNTRPQSPSRTTSPTQPLDPSGPARPRHEGRAIPGPEPAASPPRRARSPEPRTVTSGRR